MGAVYGLMDPDTKEIRYVGMTKGRAEDRYRAHIYGAPFGNTHKDKWICQLERLGKMPKLVILEEVKGGRDELADAERVWIRKGRNELGRRLTNHTNGGNGCAGLKWSPEQHEAHREIMAGASARWAT